MSKQYRGEIGRMDGAVYNSAIPGTIKSVVGKAAVSHARSTVLVLLAFFLVPLFADAADWSAQEQELSKKIVKVTGTDGAVALTFENRSSLGRRDSEIVENGLRSTLANLGLRFTTGDAAAVATTVKITLSENLTSYVWVAEIRTSAGEDSVVIESAPRPESAVHESVPVSLRSTVLWTQPEPILDVAVLEESAASTRLAVLGAETVSIYRLQNGKSQLEQAMRIEHNRPWPLDLRGRLMVRPDRSLDVYLPGVFCAESPSMPSAPSCHDSDDPWPLLPSLLSAGSSPRAFFAATRNYFTGVLTPALGKLASVPGFYSAAFFSREQHVVWIFVGTDGRVYWIDEHNINKQNFDGQNQETKNLDWGSDLTSVKTSCGAGWQVLATSASAESGDSIRAYEFPDDEAVAVSAAMDFPGPVTALWTEAGGETAIAVVRDQQTGSYDALRLALACGQ